MRGSWVMTATALALLTACGSSSPSASGDQICTARGGGDLVGVEVAADLAPIRALSLTFCVKEQCHDEQVDLSTGSTTVDDGCSGAVCSGHAVEDGTQFAYLTMPLTEDALEVSGRYRIGGRTVTLAPTTIATEASYPNGPDCGTDGFQTGIVVGTDGLAKR